MLNRLESVLNCRRHKQELTLVFSPDADALSSLCRILRLLHENEIRTQDLILKKSADSTVIAVHLRLPHHVGRETVEPILASDNSIIHFDWKD